MLAVKALRLIITQRTLSRLMWWLLANSFLAISAFCLTVPSSAVTAISFGWGDVLADSASCCTLGARGRDFVASCTRT